MNFINWLGFLLALIVMIVVARKSIWFGFFCGALVLGIFNLKFTEIFLQFRNTIFDPPILLLSVAVGLIPLIGGALEISGLMDDLVKNLKLSRKAFLAFAPAFFGMLPMPGGALLSAPMIAKAGSDIPKEKYSAINVWLRHTLILIYPLGAILITSKLANLNLYKAMLYLIPAFLLMILLAYFFLLKGIKGHLQTNKKIEQRKFLIPIFIIFFAPIVHITLMEITHFSVADKEIPLVIAVFGSLILAFIFGKLNAMKILDISKKMKPWKFFLIIIGMYFFYNIFETSKISEIIAPIIFSKSFLIVGIAAFLGFVTGRVQMPFAIILPIYYSKYGAEIISYPAFAVIFFSIFVGYVISPIHPCVSVSLEFFGSNLKSFFRTLIIPVLISLIFSLTISLIFC